jgi:hypothetical protein
VCRVGEGALAPCPPSLAFNLETLAAHVKETLELVWRGMVRWVDEKLAGAIFHDLHSQGSEVIEFVR